MYIKENILSSYTFASMFISLQKKFLYEQGGNTATDVLKHAFPVVIGRPVLAECFNCGGAVKSGSILKDPEEKRNIMGSEMQMLLEMACRRSEPNLTPPQFKTYLSDYLKRSSALKGGLLHKTKQLTPSSTATGMQDKANESQDQADEQATGSDND